MNRINPSAGLVALALAAALLAPASASAQVQEVCGALAIAEDQSLTLVGPPGYTVLTAIPPLAGPPGVDSFDAIVCDRASIFIGPVDHHVLTDLHVPLFIRNNGRLALLEVGDGELRVRFREGAPTEEERAALAVALDRATQALLAAQAQTAPAP